MRDYYFTYGNKNFRENWCNVTHAVIPSLGDPDTDPDSQRIYEYMRGLRVEYTIHVG